MTPSEALRIIRAHVAKSWSQFAIFNDLFWAIDSACDKSNIWDVHCALDEAAGEPVMLWHDRPLRTKAQVLALIDRARVRAERAEAA